MKKLSVLFLSIAMLFVCTVSVSAASSKKTTNILTNFYVQRFGVQMDEDGKVSSRETKYFTPALYTSNLENGKRSKAYSVVYKEGSVSSDDVVSEVTDKPDDAFILTIIKDLYSADGYILSSSGKVVDWDKFTTNNYEIRWYVLKYESHPSLPMWHIDGVIVEKVTQEPIEIPIPDDPGYIPPSEREPEDNPPDENPGETFEYTSNFAYIYGYNDNTMAADNNLLRSEVSAMVHRLVKQNNKLGGFVYNEANEPAFSDIEGEWFRSGIEYMNYKGAFAQASNVYPYVAVTRGETFRIICLGLGFTDKTGLSYDDYAALLYNAGYIQGDENGNLNVWNLITRAEFCSIYNNIIGRKDAKLVTADGTEITAETYGFTDLDDSEWYYETMLRATSAYDDDGYVDIELRNHRNVLDDYQ